MRSRQSGGQTLAWLLDVMRCEMGLVGPRPEREEQVLRWRLLLPSYDRRFSVLPGVTGLAQISGLPDADAEGITRRLHYDLHYVEHRSLLLDLRTMTRTAALVLRAEDPPPMRPMLAATPLEERASAPAAGDEASAQSRPAPYPSSSATAVKGVTR